MSISELTKIISSAFTEETIFIIINNKYNLSQIRISEILIDYDASSKKGDSYLSSICRFIVKAYGTNLNNGNDEEVSLPVIVKYIPKNVARQKTFRSVDFFKTEIYFYKMVWPQMKKIKLANIPNERDEIPLLLASHCDGKSDFIALEDLSYEGFKSAGRNDEFSKEELQFFLETLANFHALGIVTREKNPQFEQIASNISESYFADKYLPWYENFLYKTMGPHYQKAAKAVLPQEYHEKIANFFSRDLFGEYIKSCSIRNKFCSVTEGDSWLPNFLVKTNKHDKLVTVLIDFQLARYALITNDLLHFLYSGVPDEMLLKHWDDFISEYHQYLTKRIEELGGEKNYISLKELNDEIRNRPIVGLGMAMESSLMSILRDDEVADLDCLQGENAVPLEDVWVLPEFDRARNERLAFLVKHFIDKGLIP